MGSFAPESKWLKAGVDIEEDETKVMTIKSLTEEEVGQDKELKFVLRFKETEKALVLGAKVLRENLGKATGTFESDEVVGKKIALYVDPEVRNPAGGTVAAVRIRAKAPAKAGSAIQAKASVDSDLGFGND